jgi:Rrf2 family iron-sulfur cluster assembly transcriptional regulator
VAVDEPLDVTNCSALGNCLDGKPCLTHDLWFGLNEKIQEYLSGVNLQQLVDGQIKNNAQVSSVTLPKTARQPAQMSA